MVDERQLDPRRVWIRRAAYMTLAIAAFVGLPLLLIGIAELTGVIHFREIFGPLVWFNELSGPSFLVAFFAIIVAVSVIVYFVLKMFDSTEGGW